VPSATSATLKADPAIPVASSRVYAALRLDSATPFNRGGILGRRRALSPGMTCRLRHLSPEALAPDGLCYSVHHRLIGLIRQSGGLRVLSRTPVMDTVLDIRGSQHPVCPPHLPDFRCCTFEYCRLQYAGSPGACSSVLPHRHWPSGRKETLGNSNYPANQLHAGSPFRRLIRSLSLRPYSLLAPRADQTQAEPSPLRLPGLLLPGFQVTGSPRAPAGYDYGAKLRIAPAGLSPASTAASLAAPLPWTTGTSCHRARGTFLRRRTGA
jgi:hypothetical protein